MSVRRSWKPSPFRDWVHLPMTQPTAQEAFGDLNWRPPSVAPNFMCEIYESRGTGISIWEPIRFREVQEQCRATTSIPATMTSSPVMIRGWNWTAYRRRRTRPPEVWPILCKMCSQTAFTMKCRLRSETRRDGCFSQRPSFFRFRTLREAFPEGRWSPWQGSIAALCEDIDRSGQIPPTR